MGAPGTVGPVLRVLAELKGSDPSDAVELLEGSPARRELALELADACGAGSLVEHVRSELYATGARPRTAALGGVETLTASERRVAACAAEGQSNRDIAQALFVTPKTVEVHLSNAYRRLGIRSRRELAGSLGRPKGDCPLNQVWGARLGLPPMEARGGVFIPAA